MPGPELLGPAFSLFAPMLAGFTFGVGFWLAKRVIGRK
jgi:hypothetical protein